MSRLTSFVYDSATVIFIGVGLVGWFAGPWEFLWVAPLDIPKTGMDGATFFSQLRFFKAMEMSVGVLLWALRGQAFTQPRVTGALMLLFWSAPLGRLLTLATHGVPHTSFALLVGLELFAATVLTAEAVRVRSELRRDGLGQEVHQHTHAGGVA